jgi:hypothetical protein
MFARLTFLAAAALTLAACQPLPSVNAFSAEGREVYKENRCAFETATKTTYSPRARSCLSRSE